MYTLDFFGNMVRHKHLKLEQTKITRAKKLLGLKTEQETIEAALDLVLAEEPIIKLHRKLGGAAGRDGIEDPWK